jgi:hypothetical protein
VAQDAMVTLKLFEAVCFGWLWSFTLMVKV